MTTPTTSTQPTKIREYNARAASTQIFGRVMCSVRNHHYIIDGPEWNDCPHEEVTPAEMFLSSVASCGVELMQMLARRSDPSIQLGDVNIQIYGMVDPDNPVSPDVTLFNAVTINIEMGGVTDEQAAELVAGYRRRCPLIGTLATATPNLTVGYSILNS
jgi:uncharacterized OsmC-like protein